MARMIAPDSTPPNRFLPIANYSLPAAKGSDKSAYLSISHTFRGPFMTITNKL